MVAVMLLATLFGCGNTSETNEANETRSGQEDSLKIVTTLFYQYDFAKQIVGDEMQVELLLRAGQESHSYEPTPADVLMIQEADIFIYNGGSSELWVRKVLEGANTDEMIIMCMMDYVDVVEEEIVEGMEHDEDDGHGHDADESAHEDEDRHDRDEDESAHDDDDRHDRDADESTHEDEDRHDRDEDESVHDEDKHDRDADESAHEDEDTHDEDDHDHSHDEDEHIWTSPVNAQHLVQAIVDTVSEIDSENRELYETNGQNYIAELQALDQEFRDVVSNGVRTTLIFGDRFPLRYFVEEYGLDYFAAFPGCSTEVEPSVATIAFLTDKIKSEKIPVVYHLELSNEKIAETLCENTGATKMQFHSCHNVTAEELEAGKTYVDLMRGNLESLKAGVN